MQNIAKNSVIKMYNMAGVQVKEIWTNDTNRCETNISELPAGVYTYRIEHNHREIYSGKWVKQ